MTRFTRALLDWSLSLKTSALNRKLLRDLWRLKGQGVAIAGVIAAGIALLIATFGCVASLQQSMDGFYERHRFAHVFAPLKRAPEAIAVRLLRIPGIAELETRIAVTVTLDMPAIPEPALGRLISVPEGRQPRLNGLELRAGRLVARGREDEILVNEAFAVAHGLTVGNQIVATLNGRRRTLDIVGLVLTPEYIYALAPGHLMPDDRRFGVLWMGREALAAAFDLDQAFNDVVARLQPGTRGDDVLRQIDDVLRPYGGVGAYARADQTSHFLLSNELIQLEGAGLVAPPIFLAIAAFLLNIVITRIVAAEREQIGLLKAFGYGDWDLARQYLKLVLTIVGAGLLLGTIGGVVLGRAMTGLYSQYFKFPVLAYEVAPGLLVTAAFVSIAAGLLGGLGAVLRAARLSPAVAMAPPMPTTFGRNWYVILFERMRISQPTRMIFRHLTRWPLRTATTILGIAFAVAILIASLFFIDTARYVVSTVFYGSERQTFTVAFVEPRAAIVEQQIRRLPGVLATQPVRGVAAQLRNGPRLKRTQIVGIAQNGDLNRLLDTESRAVVPPAGGLTLSRHIAEELGVGLGDLVSVEVMQERRPTQLMPVARIVEQYMGFAAFMRLESLNTLMLEGPTVTGVHVLADSQMSNTLYRQLKDIPLVSSVNLTAAAREGFEQAMEGTMYVMIGIYAAFATIIAFGVTYNSARIAFSERARALASLRVLGFTRAEATYILLGELGLQTLVALPVGCLLGYGLALLMTPLLNTDMYAFPLVIAPATYAFSVLVVLVSSAICGLLISRRVFGLNLVAVLKTRD